MAVPDSALSQLAASWASHIVIDLQPYVKYVYRYALRCATDCTALAWQMIFVPLNSRDVCIRGGTSPNFQ